MEGTMKLEQIALESSLVGNDFEAPTQPRLLRREMQ